MIARPSSEPAVHEAFVLMRRAQELLDASDQCAAAAVLDHAMQILHARSESGSGT